MPWRCIHCLTTYEARTAWCWSCCSSGSVVYVGRRPTCAATSALRTATARELVKREWTPVTSRAYGLRVQAGALLGVYGPTGAGKSTWLLRYLDGLDGPVVLLSAEEGHGPAVGERLSRLGVRRPDFTVVAGGSLDDLAAVVRERRAVALGVDSVQTTPMQAPDLRALLGALPLRVLAFVSQVTKDGAPAGSNRLLHEADVLVEVGGGVWRVGKSRYEGTGSGGSVLRDNGGDPCSDSTVGVGSPAPSA